MIIVQRGLKAYETIKMNKVSELLRKNLTIPYM